MCPRSCIAYWVVVLGIHACRWWECPLGRNLEYTNRRTFPSLPNLPDREPQHPVRRNGILINQLLRRLDPCDRHAVLKILALAALDRVGKRQILRQ